MQTPQKLRHLSEIHVAAAGRKAAGTVPQRRIKLAELEIRRAAAVAGAARHSVSAIHDILARFSVGVGLGADAGVHTSHRNPAPAVPPLGIHDRFVRIMKLKALQRPQEDVALQLASAPKRERAAKRRRVDFREQIRQNAPEAFEVFAHERKLRVEAPAVVLRPEKDKVGGVPAAVRPAHQLAVGQLPNDRLQINGRHRKGGGQLGDRQRLVIRGDEKILRDEVALDQRHRFVPRPHFAARIEMQPVRDTVFRFVHTVGQSFPDGLASGGQPALDGACGDAELFGDVRDGAAVEIIAKEHLPRRFGQVQQRPAQRRRFLGTLVCLLGRREIVRRVLRQGLQAHDLRQPVFPAQQAVSLMHQRVHKVGFGMLDDAAVVPVRKGCQEGLGKQVLRLLARIAFGFGQASDFIVIRKQLVVHRRSYLLSSIIVAAARHRFGRCAKKQFPIIR